MNEKRAAEPQTPVWRNRPPSGGPEGNGGHLSQGTEAVDGWRGLAILLVLGYHTWLFSWLTPQLTVGGIALPLDAFVRTGYLGVELFFAISGFCLFLPYARAALAGRSPQSLRSFAHRRAIKIVPSYLLALLVTAALAAWRFATPQALLGALASHLALLQNWSNDPFGQDNSVLWSLGVEVQFYLIFPLLALLFARAPLPTALAMGALALGYRLALAPCCLAVEPVMRQVPAYLDLFAAGMSAAYLLVALRARIAPSALRSAAATAAALALALAACALVLSCNAVQYDPHGADRWALWHRSLLALVIGGLLLTSCLAARWWRTLVANPLLWFLSVISYNLYLWHTVILIWMWKHGVPHAATPDPHQDDHWKPLYIALGWSVCLIVSTALTYFVERPLLATVRPHRFAFDWGRLVRRLRGPGLTARAPGPSLGSGRRT
ncbi:MAG: acyltransferase family protein [Vulcanimicrobiaceae bacterium]